MRLLMYHAKIITKGKLNAGVQWEEYICKLSSIYIYIYIGRNKMMHLIKQKICNTKNILKTTWINVKVI